MKSLRAVAAALSLGSSAYAAISKQTVGTDITYSLNIPESTANSGSGDIFFQLSASTSYEWVALGQGTGMAGANIFVMYTDSTGKNVTVSPRLGTGYTMPNHDTAAKIVVLEGSGVKNGKMIANVQCSNCASWSGGSMDFSSDSGDFLYAYKSGSPLDSDDLDAQITEHEGKAAFAWPLSAAKGGSDANPFIGAGTSTDGSNSGASSSAAATSSYTVSGTVIPGTCTPISASQTASGSAAVTGKATTTGAADGCPTPPFKSRPPSSCLTRYSGAPTHPPKVKRNDECPSGYESTSNSVSPDITSGSTSGVPTTIILAHGVLACISFVALFPIGGILIRVANFPGLLWVHAALQGFGFLFYIVAFGMGVYMATNLDLMSNPHAIIGVALLILLLLQPVFGLLHHKLYKKYGHRTLWSYAHIWHGRVAVLLGIVNGGLGIRLARTVSSGGKIAYAVVAAIMGLTYIGLVIFGEIRRRKQPPSYEKSERSQERSQRRQSHQLRDLSSSEENVQHVGYYGGRKG